MKRPPRSALPPPPFPDPVLTWCRENGYESIEAWARDSDYEKVEFWVNEEGHPVDIHQCACDAMDAERSEVR